MPLNEKIAFLDAYRESMSRDPDSKAVRSREGARSTEVGLLDLQILLATQSLSSDASGASIVETLVKNERYVEWPARVYAAIERLERDGLICKAGEEQVLSRRRGRPRSAIKLTPSGQRVLDQSLRTLDLLRQNGEFARPDEAGLGSPHPGTMQGE